MTRPVPSRRSNIDTHRVTRSPLGPRSFHRDRRGSLALILLLIAVVFSLALTFLSRTSGERHLTRRLLLAERAEQMAEAAVAEAFWSVQQTMNRSGTEWYRQFRLPAPQAGAEQVVTLPESLRLMGEASRSEGGESSVECALRLRGLQPLQDPAAEPEEKTGFLEADVRVTIGPVVRRLRRVREVRVVRVGPPALLAPFTLWVTGAPGPGSIRAPGGLPGSPPGTLDPAILRAARRDWTYRWGSSRSGYPFSRARVSQFHATWQEFLDRTVDAAGTVHLAGVTVIGEAGDHELKQVSLTGQGALLLMEGSLTLRDVSVPQESDPKIAVLAQGAVLEVDPGGTSSPFRGHLMAPEGEVVTAPGLVIEGSVHAGQWDRSSPVTLRSRRQPLPHVVTLSEVSFEIDDA